ncbi:MAG: hypothetical protein OEV93_00905 [Candidatus Moranbacteria bacterium]|nr:hypothetical protein [Candidatus Moranbacteria bacterium]
MPQTTQQALFAWKYPTILIFKRKDEILGAQTINLSNGSPNISSEMTLSEVDNEWSAMWCPNLEITISSKFKDWDKIALQGNAVHLALEMTTQSIIRILTQINTICQFHKSTGKSYNLQLISDRSPIQEESRMCGSTLKDHDIAFLRSVQFNTDELDYIRRELRRMNIPFIS